MPEWEGPSPGVREAPHLCILLRGGLTPKVTHGGCLQTHKPWLGIEGPGTSALAGLPSAATTNIEDGVQKGFQNTETHS